MKEKFKFWKRKSNFLNSRSYNNLNIFWELKSIIFSLRIVLRVWLILWDLKELMKIFWKAMNSFCMKVKKQSFKIILLRYLLLQFRTAFSNFSFSKTLFLPRINLLKMFKCLQFKIQKLINLIKIILLPWMILFHQVLEILKTNKTYIFKTLICQQINFKEIKKLKFNRTKTKTNGANPKKNMTIPLYTARKWSQTWTHQNWETNLQG